MNKYPLISIIIPLYVIEDRFFRDLEKFKDLKYSNYEILIVCDKKIELKNPKVMLVYTGEKRTGPAEKRDLALKYAKGDICAFIDDDAYPDPMWLTSAVKAFENKKIVAVGGTGLTPTEDSYFEKVGGLIYQSPLVSGGFSERFVKGRNSKSVNDWPAYNLFVRTDILKKVGGYGSYFYGGEDTFLCLKLMKHGLIMYEPDVIVFHHRRAFLLLHLKQILNVGIHRGYFARVFPETSRMLIYFMPSLLVVSALISIFLAFMNIKLFNILAFTFIAFYALSTLSVLNKGSFTQSILAGIGIILTHIVYGVGFIKGISSTSIKR